MQFQRARIETAFIQLSKQLFQDGERYAEETGSGWNPFVARAYAELVRHPWTAAYYPPDVLDAIRRQAAGWEEVLCPFADVLELVHAIHHPTGELEEKAALTLMTEQTGLVFDGDALAELREQELHTALNRLEQLPPNAGLEDPAAHIVLRERAGEMCMSPATLLRREIFPEAVWLVGGNIYTPQRIQIEEERIKDADGHWTPKKPSTLSAEQLVQWLPQRIYRAAAAILLDQPYPGPGKKMPIIPAPIEIPLNKLVEAKIDLVRLRAVASPKQRAVLDLLQDKASIDEIASILRVSRSTVYTHIERLTQKYKEI